MPGCGGQPGPPAASIVSEMPDKGTSMATDDSSKVPAARNALRILTFLATQRGPVAAAHIASALDLPRSSTYQLLRVLEDQGYVSHFPEVRRFGLGITAFELGSGYLRQKPLARIGAPIVTALVDKLGESAHLAVLRGQDVIYVVEERAKNRPALVTGVGIRLPSHLTASGRAMLAKLPAAQVRALFPNAASFSHRGQAPPPAYSDLKRTLDEVRRTHYAIEDGEVTPGLSSVARAVTDQAGWPVAAIAITFQSERIPQERWPQLAELLSGYSNELGRRIHGRLMPA